MNAAIYAKDVRDQKFSELRALVESKGFANILEYRDITPVRGRSGNKQFRNMLQDAKQGKFKVLFIDSFADSGMIGSNNLTVLMTIVILRSCKVRFISRAEPWVDLSDQEFALVFQMYCDNQKEEMERSFMKRQKNHS